MVCKLSRQASVYYSLLLRRTVNLIIMKTKNSFIYHNLLIGMDTVIRTPMSD